MTHPTAIGMTHAKAPRRKGNARRGQPPMVVVGHLSITFFGLLFSPPALRLGAFA